MAELDFEYDGKEYKAVISASKGVAFVTLVYGSNNVAVPPGNPVVEMLHQKLQESFGDNLQPIQRTMSGGTAQIKVTMPSEVAESNGYELYLALERLVGVGSDLSAGSPQEELKIKRILGVEAPPQSTLIDPAKLQRASVAAYMGFGKIIPESQSLTRYTAFLYNMSHSPNVDFRQAATQFLVDNFYTSSDRETNKALVDAMVDAAKQFIAAEQQLIAR